MEPFEIIFYGSLGIMIFGALLWFMFTKVNYTSIDDKYFIYRIGFYFYVHELDKKRIYFKNYSDCLAYIEKRKKEDK